MQYKKKFFSALLAGIVLLSASTSTSSYNPYNRSQQNSVNLLFSSQSFKYIVSAILLGGIAIGYFWYLKPKNKVRSGHAELQGNRPTMEDRHIAAQVGKENFFFGIFDGHIGTEAADYTKNRLIQNFNKSEAKTIEGKLTESVEKTDKDFLTDPQFLENLSGTTAIVTLVDRTGKKVTFANCGDSRAILIRNGKIIFHTEDHKPNVPAERQRIEQAGGLVPADGPFQNRVNGNLALSRAIGDRSFKNYGVISTPDVTEQNVQENDIVVLACDGVWDVMDNETVAKFVYSRRNQNANTIAQALVHEAYNRKSNDNISALVVPI